MTPVSVDASLQASTVLATSTELFVIELALNR
jgi:hypothetical protein